MNDCIFCKIISEEIPAFKIWENEEFIAILDKFPKVTGMTLIIPKKHLDSYIVKVEDDDLQKLLHAMKEVAKILDRGLEGIIRTTFSLEGLDVAHLHAKLIPYYGPDFSIPRPEMADDKYLKKIADRLQKQTI